MNVCIKGFAAAALLALCIAPSVTASAATTGPAVLSAIPDSVLGVLVVNNLKKADADFDTLARSVGAPAHSILLQIKVAFGGGEGLDENGSLGVALFASDTPGGAPSVITFVPVTDYKKLVGGMKAKNPDADVAEVDLGTNGLKVFAAHKGDFAAVTEPGQKNAEDLLKQIVASKQSVDSVVAPLADWSSEHGFAAIATPAGLKQAVASARQAIQLLRAVTKQAGGDQAEMAASGFDMYDSMLNSVEANVTVAGIAGKLLDGGALRIDGRVVYKGTGSGAGLATSGSGQTGSGLNNLPMGNFLLAMAGAFPQSAMKTLIPMSMQIIKNAAKTGGKPLTDDQVKQLTDTMQNAWSGVRSMSFVMGVPPVGDSLYAQTVMVLSVDNATTFMANYSKSLEQMAALAKQADNPLFPMTTTEKTTIDGKEGMAITVDMSAMMAKMANKPGADAALKSLVGPSGKLKAYLLPVDAKTVVFSYISTDNIKTVTGVMQNPAKSLASDPDVRATLKTLPPGAQWTGLMSLRGLVDVVSMVVSKMAGPNGMTIPAFPAAPPVGMTVESSASKLDFAIALPAPTLNAIGKYVQTLTVHMMQQRQPAQGQPQFQ